MSSPRSAAVSIVARAPASIGNLGPGLDVLGAAVTGLYDHVQATWSADTTGITIADAGHPALPTDAARNACGIAAHWVLERATVRQGGIRLHVTKGIPLAGGQGGSGASAVAAAVAVDQLIVHAGGVSVGTQGLLEASLAAESVVAGRHLDNLAASLLGGVICVRAIDPPDVRRVPVVADLWFALVQPDIQIRTADARLVLPTTVSREIAVAQLASVAALVTGLANGDLDFIGRALVDHIAEPARASLIPGYAAVRSAAMDAGAVGIAISGGGPTMFAICNSEASAQGVAAAMERAFGSVGHAAHGRTAQLDLQGATWHTA